MSRKFGARCCMLMATAAASAAGAQAARAAPAAEQSPAAAQETGLDEIVVTAQKRETNLQRTPIAISVVGDEELANRHIQSLTDLGDGTVPSLRIGPSQSTRKSALVVNIRGVGVLGDPNLPARDLGVGVYLDGVYLGRSQGLGAALYDIERIEVLKGPQGTLFGRNTEGGAVSIVTKRPSGEARLELIAGISNYGGREVMVHADLPAVHDISIKLDGLLQKRGGTVDNPLVGRPDFDTYNRKGFHAGVLWKPSANFSALYDFDISYDSTTPLYFQLVAPGTVPLAPLTKIQADRAERTNYGVPLQPSVGKAQGHLLTLDWEPSDDLHVRSISSYRELTQSQYDLNQNLHSFSPNGLFGRLSIANFFQHQYSQELQLIGKLPEISFVAGAYYFHESVRDDAWGPNTLRWNANGTDYTVLPTPISTTPFPDRESTATTDSSALFGQATWTPSFLNDVVHLTIGGRYSGDRKKGTLLLVNGFTPTVNGITAPQKFDFRSNRIDPLVNLLVDLSPDIHVYGKWSTGYRAGGANSRSLTYRQFGPESVSVFEVGAKMEFFDRRVRLNLAAYTGAYKDVQIDFNVFLPGANRATTETTNASGAGRVKGVEAELTVSPARGLTLSGSYSHNKVHLPQAPNPFIAGSPLVPVFQLFSPEHMATAAVNYEMPVGPAKLFLHLDANYSTGQWVASTAPNLLSDAAVLVNGRIAIADIPLGAGSSTVGVALWGRNILNESHANGRVVSVGAQYAIFNEPRMFGVQVTSRF